MALVVHVNSPYYHTIVFQVVLHACIIRLYSNVLNPRSYITMVQSGACGIPYSFVILDRKGWICNREVPKVDVNAAVIVCNNFGITVFLLNYISKKAK